MKRLFILISLIGFLDCCYGQNKVVTFCNPMNINYRFQSTSRLAYREAADPVIVIYKGKYFLYASHRDMPLIPEEPLSHGQKTTLPQAI